MDARDSTDSIESTSILNHKRSSKIPKLTNGSVDKLFKLTYKYLNGRVPSSNVFLPNFVAVWKSRMPRLPSYCHRHLWTIPNNLIPVTYHLLIDKSQNERFDQWHQLSRSSQRLQWKNSTQHPAAFQETPSPLRNALTPLQVNDRNRTLSKVMLGDFSDK